MRFLVLWYYHIIVDSGIFVDSYPDERTPTSNISSEVPHISSLSTISKAH